MADVWQLFGNASSITSLASFIFGGASVISVYQTLGSPYATLQDCGSKLKEVREQLQAVSPRRREEIAAACRRKAPQGETPKSLEELENIYEMFVF